ncbi:MAG: hypothetical protein NZM06_04840 [Chloroherpetonaceae bacterium]|nr:hypothetical protein [Chloroherpetonaceae bacterium]MDW8437848.1 hypothetical protein [Chloroherpetonaceae bacterium]
MFDYLTTDQKEKSDLERYYDLEFRTNADIAKTVELDDLDIEDYEQGKKETGDGIGTVVYRAGMNLRNLIAKLSGFGR